TIVSGTIMDSSNKESLEALKIAGKNILQSDPNKMVIAKELQQSKNFYIQEETPQETKSPAECSGYAEFFLI
ncbi:hypothetical protein AVEN_22983-1, partial [Araneus ventricosus]